MACFILSLSADLYIRRIMSRSRSIRSFSRRTQIGDCTTAHLLNMGPFSAPQNHIDNNTSANNGHGLLVGYTSRILTRESNPSTLRSPPPTRPWTIPCVRYGFVSRLCVCARLSASRLSAALCKIRTSRSPRSTHSHFERRCPLCRVLYL